MTALADRELLHRYARRNDHDAFAELVRRYVAPVRSAALRQTREPGLADDVTQAAMIVLARRVREIPPNVVLASWLFTVTHHIAQNAIKSRARRVAHETEAAARRIEHRPPDDELRDVLDAAIARLPELERGGIVLHYFNDCTHEQIAAALGMTREAVRKRVTRGLLKLRDFVATRGFDLSTQSLGIALTTEAASRLSATVGTDSIVSVALLSTSNGATGTSASVILANGILGSAKTSLKWKIAASIAITAIGFTGIATLQMPAPSAQATAVENQTTAPATTQPVGFVTQVTDNIRIRALGCAAHPADPDGWFGVDGKLIDMPHEALADNKINSDSQPDRQIAFLIDSPVTTRFIVDISGAFTNSVNMNQTAGQPSLMRCRFGLNDPNRETLSVAFNIATGDWQTVATAEGAEPVEVDADGLGPVTFSPPVNDPRWGPRVDVRHARVDLTMQLLAIDANGKEHQHQTQNTNNDGGDINVSSFIFDIPANDIRSVKLQIREFDKRVEFTNIAMQAEQQTEPKIEVKDLKPKK